TRAACSTSCSESGVGRTASPRTRSSSSRINTRRSGSASRPRRLYAPRKLLDLPLRRVQTSYAQLVELLAALPQLDCLVEIRVAAFEPLDDSFELSLRVFEGLLRHSARAPKRPSATSISTSSPELTAATLLTIASSRRTIA